VNAEGKPFSIYGKKIPTVGIEIPQGSGGGDQGSGRKLIAQSCKLSSLEFSI
jgi:hypothetical protein